MLYYEVGNVEGYISYAKLKTLNTVKSLKELTLKIKQEFGLLGKFLKTLSKFIFSLLKTRKFKLNLDKMKNQKQYLRKK